MLRSHQRVSCFVSETLYGVRELATEVFGIPPKSDETIPRHQNHLTRPHITMGNESISIGQKACVLALLEEGVPLRTCEVFSDLSFSTVYLICQVMYDCGYHPAFRQEQQQ